MTAGALLRESTDAGNNWTNLISSFFETIETPYEIVSHCETTSMDDARVIHPY